MANRNASPYSAVLAKIIRGEMRKADVTQAHLLPALGYNVSTLQRKLAGVSEITAEDVAIIGNFIGVPAAQMIDEASAKVAATNPVSEAHAHNVSVFPRPVTVEEIDNYPGAKAAMLADEESQHPEE